MPIYEAADKALKTFQEEFMPVETFSEFLDAAGQCQDFLSQKSSTAKPMSVLEGPVLASVFTAEGTQARTSLSVTAKRSGRDK